MQQDENIQWDLKSDGDLWKQVHAAIKAKGVDSIKIKWVKGHATDKHVKMNITTEKDRTGNNIADDTADVGTSPWPRHDKGGTVADRQKQQIC